MALKYTNALEVEGFVADKIIPGAISLAFRNRLKVDVIVIRKILNKSEDVETSEAARDMYGAYGELSSARDADSNDITDLCGLDNPDVEFASSILVTNGSFVFDDSISSGDEEQRTAITLDQNIYAQDYLKITKDMVKDKFFKVESLQSVGVTKSLYFRLQLIPVTFTIRD